LAFGCVGSVLRGFSCCFCYEKWGVQGQNLTEIQLI
jgi:hypothetical protein